MSLKFEDNLVKDFDLQQTFGKLNYLSTQAIYESDSEGGRTELVREQRMTVYSEAKGDQIDITLPAETSLKEIQYDDEIELTGEVNALAWLSSYTGYNDSIQSEQAFKIRAEGVKKRDISIPNKHVKEKQPKHN